MNITIKDAKSSDLNNINELLRLSKAHWGYDNAFLDIGKGVGRMLWHTCCQEAKNQGQSEFIIWSDPNAEKFYIKMGCKKIGVRKSPMMPDRHPPILKFKL